MKKRSHHRLKYLFSSSAFRMFLIGILVLKARRRKRKGQRDLQWQSQIKNQRSCHYLRPFEAFSSLSIDDDGEESRCSGVTSALDDAEGDLQRRKQSEKSNKDEMRTAFLPSSSSIGSGWCSWISFTWWSRWRNTSFTSFFSTRSTSMRWWWRRRCSKGRRKDTFSKILLHQRFHFGSKGNITLSLSLFLNQSMR